MSNTTNNNTSTISTTINAAIDSLALKSLNMSYRPKGPSQAIPEPVVRGHSHSTSTSTTCTNWASQFFHETNTSFNTPDVPTVPDVLPPPKRSIFHFHSRSNSGSGNTATITTNTTAVSTSDVVARIIAQDAIVAAEKRKMLTAIHDASPATTCNARGAPKPTTTNGCAGAGTGAGAGANLTRRYPERLESRRALLSFANGAKAPIVLGTSTTTTNNNNRRTEARAGMGNGTTATYMHKQLPPTPPSSASTGCVLSPSTAAIVVYANRTPPSTKLPLAPLPKNHPSPPRRTPLGPSTLSSPPRKPSLAPVPERSSALPPVRPLNLSVHITKPTETHKASPPQQQPQPQPEPRLMDRVVPARPAITPFPSKRHSRFVNVPAPIYAPRINGPRAFNGPLSATTSDEESEDELLPVVGYNATGERIGLQEKEKEKEEEEEEQTQEVAGVVVAEMDQIKKLENGGVDQNPQGTGPLDIPVDWDDLHERWTSPVMIVHDENALAELLLSSMSMPSSSSSSSPSSSSSSSDEGEEQKGLPVDVASVIVDEDSDAEVDAEERQREDGQALMAFQADVNDLFARSPSLEVEGREEEEEEEGVMGDERGFGSDDEEEKDEWDQDVIVRFPAPPGSAASPSFVPAGAPSPYSPYPLSMLLRESTLAPPSLHHRHHHHSSSTSLPLPSISPVETEKDEVVLPVPLPLLNESGEKNTGSGSDSGRAKRHGRVMVTKPVKLSLDIDIAQAVDRALALAEEGEDESSEEEEELWPAVKKQTITTTTTTNTTTTSAAAAAAAAGVVPVPRVTLSPLVLPGQNRNKRSSELRIHRGCFKAGESFLMMGSPLSPESASTAGMRTSLCW